MIEKIVDLVNKAVDKAVKDERKRCADVLSRHIDKNRENGGEKAAMIALRAALADVRTPEA